ncbi:MAG: chromate transporter [Candidatus Velthaea sp.]
METVLMLWRLAAAFSILSLLGFGGGNAIIPQMHADAVDRFHWITSADFSRFYAVGRLAPGPTTTIAALVGLRVAGYAGAAVAALAVFVPAALVVWLLGRLWERFHAHPWRDLFARAMAPVVLGLIFASVATIAKGALDGYVTVAVALAAAALMLRTNVNQPLLILCAGVVGALILR